MKKKQHITAFYLETLLMIVVFISIILVLTRVFGSARVQSEDARKLTAAVTLAQNTAEAVSASQSPRDLLDHLDDGGNAGLEEDGETGQTLVTAAYDVQMKPLPLPEEYGQEAGNTGLIVRTAWIPDGEMVQAVITVLDAGTGRTVYTLDTAVYLKEK